MTTQTAAFKAFVDYFDTKEKQDRFIYGLLSVMTESASWSADRIIDISRQAMKVSEAADKERAQQIIDESAVFGTMCNEIVMAVRETALAETDKENNEYSGFAGVCINLAAQQRRAHDMLENMVSHLTNTTEAGLANELANSTTH